MKNQINIKKKTNKQTNLSTDETTESEGRELASVNAILIEMTNVDLYGRVVLGGDESVRRRAVNRIENETEISHDSPKKKKLKKKKTENKNTDHFLGM